MARGGNNKLAKVKNHKIPLVHPSWFNTAILSKNGNEYANKKLLIQKKTRKYKSQKKTVYSTLAADGGCLPRMCFVEIFGVKSSLVRYGNDGNEYDVFNCDIKYLPQFGDLLVSFDLAWRMKRSTLPWQTNWGPMETLPN